MKKQIGLAFTISVEDKAYASMSISGMENGTFVPGSMDTFNLCEPAQDEAGATLLSEVRQAIEKYRSAIGS